MAAVEGFEGWSLIVQILNRKNPHDIRHRRFSVEEQRLLMTLWKSDPSLFDLQSEKNREIMKQLMVSRHGNHVWLATYTYFFNTFNKAMHEEWPEATRTLSEQEREIYRMAVIALTSFCQINGDRLVDREIPQEMMLFFVALNCWYIDVRLFDKKQKLGLDRRFLLELEGTFLQMDALAQSVQLLIMCAQTMHESGTDEFRWDRDQHPEVFPGQRHLDLAYDRVKALYALMEAIEEAMANEELFTQVYVCMITQLAAMMAKIIREHPVCGYLLRFRLLRRAISQAITASRATLVSEHNMDHLIEEMERADVFAHDRAPAEVPRATLRKMSEDDWKGVREQLTEELRKLETFGAFVARCAQEECATCADRPISTIFLACGHVFMCLECFEGKEAYNYEGTCPLCKKVSKEVLSFAPDSDQQ